jgi:acyl-CoA hydrolase
MSRGNGGSALFDDAARLADFIVDRVGKSIVLALPLGLGKANHVANALYAKAVADPSIRLTIFTALTLEPPRVKSDLERRFLEPFAARVFKGYPALDYAIAIHAGMLAPNVTVNEFFVEAGQWLNSPYAQQHYISANYTHALRAVLERGVNVVGQLVAHDPAEAPRPYSLSCNPDLSLDLLAMRRAGKASFLCVGQLNSGLPFMPGEAAIAADEFDVLLDSPATDFPLFAAPREPVTLADYAAGLHAASLIPDGGTIQIGIGSLGDAVAQALVLRHRQPDQFRALLTQISPGGAVGRHTEPFASGLYACTELFVDGLLDLFNVGILKREVNGAVLHAGFFLGCHAFQRALREMPRDLRAKFHMTSIAYVNDLYGAEEEKRRARTGARFINNAMMATLLGDVISDALEDGRVVSGVGGQYNFVAQAFALEDARSVIMLRASRAGSGKQQSNIRWNYGHITIPRHLRDIVVTEYGVADIRNKSDRDVIVAMLAVTDARFQDELLRRAKDAGKLEKSFKLPNSARRDNTPDAIERTLQSAMNGGLLPRFPFGSDFTEIEQRLLPALIRLKLASSVEVAELLLRGLFAPTHDPAALERLGLARPQSLREWLTAALVRGALA